MSRVEAAPVLQGALAAAVIALLAGNAQRFVADGSTATFGLLLVIVAAMGIGGFIAGRPQPSVALTAGGLAAGIGSAVAQLLNLVVAIARSRSPTAGSLVFIVFIVLVSTSMGMIGGYLAFRRASNDDEDGRRRERVA